MALKGKIQSWNKAKGFGFISPQSGVKPLFVHISDLKQGKRIPDVGESVRYVKTLDNQNRSCAKQVVFLKKNTSRTKMKLKSFLIIFSVLFLSAVAASVLLGRLPVWVLIIYAVLSLVTFVIYCMDKSAARKNKWRTKENTLQLLALFGGWPGAILGQQLFRHKSKKTSFQVIFWLTVIVNLVFYVWLHTEQATPYLAALQNHINTLHM